MEDFVVLLKKFMIEENGYTAAEADDLIKKHVKIVVPGIMAGPFALRPIVMAIEMAEINSRLKNGIKEIDGKNN